MHLSWPVAVVLVVIALILFYLFPVLVFLAIIIGILYAAGYYRQTKCPSCGARDTIGLLGSEVVKTEKAYGLVDRMDTTTTRRRNRQGGTTKEESTTTRQERAPIIRTTTRTTYHCRKCGYNYSRESVDEEEDFARDETPSGKETVILQKEIVKVPCRYCGTLNEVTRRTCSNCGASIK